ncbi:MAG TPA: AgmX/PglI C-terminal domain-containing protein [Steroidobacteraceae bacterium]|nr:AgmX/PglI C-terminal domain-containing protein [Steroidobacteraceae bacterium]
MSSVAVNFRIFELPWTASRAEERRFRWIVACTLGLLLAAGIVIHEMPVRERPNTLQPAVPERIVDFILQQPKPPPPKVQPPKPKDVELPKVQARNPVPQVRPQVDARKRAASSGLLAQSAELEELRDMDVDRNPTAKPNNAGIGDKTRVDRFILTQKSGEGSGGIAVASASHGFGGGSSGLKGNSTASVGSSVEALSGPQAKRYGSGGKAGRSREEIELVFDRNKSAIYALYSRALRDNPSLQGKVVLEVTIAPSGEVTDCHVVSSDLHDPDLERKLVTRVKMFRFEAKDVATMTTTKPIEFFPA